MKIFILLLLFFNVLASESGVLYRNDKLTISFDKEHDEFVVKDKSGLYRTPRFRYRDIMLNSYHQVPKEDQEELTARLEKIKTLVGYQEPSPEELLIGSMDTLNALNYELDEDCPKLNFAALEADEPQVMLVLQEDDTSELFSLGEMTGYEILIDSKNDNILHGIPQVMGIDTYGKDEPLTGDDRGLTFGASIKAKLKYDDGEILLSYGTQAYTKLSPQPCGKVWRAGYAYQQYCYKNEDGKYTQEGLNREDYDIKVLKRIGEDNKTFVEFGAGITVLDDKGGALKAQEAWHSATEGMGTIQYENIDHQKKKVAPKASFKIGRVFDLTKETSNISISARPYVGAQISGIGESENQLTYGGDIRIQFNSDDKKSKFPTMESRFYYDGAVAQDGAKHEYYGVEQRFNFEMENSKAVYLKVGVGIEDDALSRVFENGTSSLLHRDLDLQHYIGIGFEKKF